jgi:hypothetical protein
MKKAWLAAMLPDHGQARLVNASRLAAHPSIARL